MMKIFLACSARNNEEYRKVLRTRMNLMLFVFIMGLTTLCLALFFEPVFAVTTGDFVKGVYTGIGTGLMVAAAFARYKIKWILSDDGKIKSYRLKDTDERRLEIRQKAITTSAFIFVFVLYAVVLIAGFFYPILFPLLIGLMGFLGVTYFITYKFYEKRM